jgi:DNA-binding NtrC family response regulator
MTRLVLLIGGTAEEAEGFRAAIEGCGTVLERATEGTVGDSRARFDAVLALDPSAISELAHQGCGAVGAEAWLAVVDKADTDSVAMARRGGAVGLIVRGSSKQLMASQIRTVLERLQLRQQCGRLRNRLRETGAAVSWVGRSPAALAVGELISRVAPLRIPLLIQGERGTGRTHLAHRIHATGPRHDRPLVTLDCAVVDPLRLGARLFGKERGTFVCGERGGEGALVAAEGGTLILEEVGALPDPLQAMLLEFLQTGRYKRMGGSQPERGDVRVIAIADKSLDERLHTRAFRLDLFQAIQLLKLTLPPLRERREDIIPLLFHFLERDRDLCHPPVTGVSPRALTQFLNHDWPGNVRELESALRTACALSIGPVLEAWQPPRDPTSPAAQALASDDIDIARPLSELTLEAIESVERTYLDQVLRRYRGRIAPAARHSGLSRRAVTAKVQKYALPLDEYRA